MRRSLAMLAAMTAIAATPHAARTQSGGIAEATTASDMMEEGPDEAVIAVRFGLDGPDMDACGTTGVAAPGEPVPVLVSPEATAAEIDRIAPGQALVQCDTSEDRAWVGVVYQRPDDPPADCGTASPIAAPRDYDGACRSGWIPADRFVLEAG